MAPHSRGFKIGIYDPDEDLFDERAYFELFQCVVRAMRFSHDITVDNAMSKLLPNGTWTGLVGLLNRTEIDYAPGFFIVTEERWHAVAFNAPVHVYDTTFATRKPTFSPEVMAIFRTVSLSVWLSLLVSTVLVTLVCMATLKYRYTSKDIMFHVLAIGLNQKGKVIPQKSGEFMLLCTWMLAMTLFTCCFKSVLLSFLSFPPLSGVRTVPELAAAIRDGTYSAVSEKNSYLPIFLQGSPNDDIRLIGENSLQNPPGYLPDLFEKNLEDTNVALVYPRTYLLFAEENLYVSKDSMGSYFVASAVSKDFCCKDEVDTITNRFLAAGIDQKINNFANFKEAFRIFSKISDDDASRKITLVDISGAFILLVAGYCLSVCTLLIELWMKNI